MRKAILIVVGLSLISTSYPASMTEKACYLGGGITIGWLVATAVHKSKEGHRDLAWTCSTAITLNELELLLRTSDGRRVLCGVFEAQPKEGLVSLLYNNHAIKSKKRDQRKEDFSTKYGLNATSKGRCGKLQTDLRVLYDTQLALGLKQMADYVAIPGGSVSLQLRTR